MILIAGILGACNTLHSESEPQNIATGNAQTPVSIADYGSRIGFKGDENFGELMAMKFGYKTAHCVYNNSIQLNTAQYKNYSDKSIKQVVAKPVGAFSLDKDTASYTNSRRFISVGRIPHPDAVRVEEFINYFPDASNEKFIPLSGFSFVATYELTLSPWNADKVLLRINIKVRNINLINC
ncbi:VWA domain-containing protein [Snodgrassella gandavensis]|uniref:VWA domain-containing protein n=1 Tax=Snodgrassella gandavensis TaxID=2946698 RepID=UPI001EF62499|nr:von Willebrand factor type A domain-containing protein [Snodgrassella gandavensis]